MKIIYLVALPILITCSKDQDRKSTGAKKKEKGSSWGSDEPSTSKQCQDKSKMKYSSSKTSEDSKKKDSGSSWGSTETSSSGKVYGRPGNKYYGAAGNMPSSWCSGSSSREGGGSSKDFGTWFWDTVTPPRPDLRSIQKQNVMRQESRLRDKLVTSAFDSPKLDYDEDKKMKKEYEKYRKRDNPHSKNN